ncbi:hypothetical protein O0I10_010205 [Lichtheimia ornata]|uniref:Uncharacterized protein n=1 Tax=Lichtheimia ornata TaxID=688661 RepID=A0AAD7UVQ4_9FUNG|nr:uncharacterized protein O0I10_010205 [Lichtheimia ornata]KAJ8654130.1 hypothetical protein O0I10_010205 [Lichtheimia ornata]
MYPEINGYSEGVLYTIDDELIEMGSTSMLGQPQSGFKAKTAIDYSFRHRHTTKQHYPRLPPLEKEIANITRTCYETNVVTNSNLMARKKRNEQVLLQSVETTTGRHHHPPSP